MFRNVVIFVLGPVFGIVEEVVSVVFVVASIIIACGCVHDEGLAVVVVVGRDCVKCGVECGKCRRNVGGKQRRIGVLVIVVIKVVSVFFGVEIAVVGVVVGRWHGLCGG